MEYLWAHILPGSNWLHVFLFQFPTHTSWGWDPFPWRPPPSHQALMYVKERAAHPPSGSRIGAWRDIQLILSNPLILSWENRGTETVCAFTEISQPVTDKVRPSLSPSRTQTTFLDSLSYPGVMGKSKGRQSPHHHCLVQKVHLVNTYHPFSLPSYVCLTKSCGYLRAHMKWPQIHAKSPGGSWCLLEVFDE